MNAYKYKLLGKTKWHWSSLRAGDCIFMPSGWLHQIRSYGRSISSSVYFSSLGAIHNTTKSEQFGMCDERAPLFAPLESVASHFLWTYTHGERHINPRRLQGTARSTVTHAAKAYLLNLVRRDDARLALERFVDFFDEITREIKRDAHVDTFVPAVRQLVALNATEVWRDFFPHDANEPRYLTLEQIGQLGLAQLDRFVKILNLAANYHDFGSEYRLGRDEL